jgi:transcriptional regulator with XRE-family HTH domain
MNNKEIKFEISKRFKEARDFLGLSQEALGEKLSCSQGKIKSIETGRTWIPVETALKFSEIFDVSLEWLLQNNGKMFKKENFLNNIEDLKNNYNLDVDDVNILHVLITDTQKRKTLINLMK